MNASKTNNDPTFRIYPVEQGVAIIRAIAEHRWPMHLNEAFALRDQFGWKPAPDNGRFFTTPVSNDEEDGFIVDCWGFFGQCLFCASGCLLQAQEIAFSLVGSAIP